MALYTGGRHVYKKWEENAEGDRIASRCYSRSEAMLQSTYLYNPNGSEILRYIRLDIDAQKTRPEWKDESNGAICWRKIGQELKENYPDILRQVEWVTRSDSKLGLHILIGLSPLPLSEQTSRTQFFCRKIQRDLMEILNELGIGADRAGQGLKQDFATFRNSGNIVHHNRFLTRNIDNQRSLPAASREKFLNNLNKACDEALVSLEIKNGYRLYRDLRLEPKIAKLFLYLLGMHTPEELSSDEGLSHETNKLSYATPNSCELSLDQISFIMGTNKRNIYKSFWERAELQNLFHVEKTTDNTLRITIKDSKVLFKRIQRALAILNHKPCSLNFHLIPPQAVADGQRNSSIVSWALALKWHGVSKELTLLKIASLVRQIPGYEDSSSCKKSQIKATVASLYRNQRGTTGSRFEESLPFWLEVSVPEISPKSEANKKTTISTSRSIQGASFLGGGSGALSFMSLELSVMVHDCEGLTEDPGNWGEKSKENKQNDNLIPNVNSINSQKIRAVAYKNRVGFFLNEELLLCVIKNRHYKLTTAIAYLQQKILGGDFEINIFKDVIHMRHNTKDYQNLAQILYAPATLAFHAETICGHKKKQCESLDEFGRKKAMGLGISYEEYKKSLKKNTLLFSVPKLCEDVPF